VSLYNESPAGSVDPTPTVGMVGLIEKEKHITTQGFRGEGDAILLLGDPGNEMGGSHYLKVIHGRKEGLPPRLDYDRELAVQHAVRALIRMGFVHSAHDCSEGGLAVALAECCMSGQLGAEVSLPDGDPLVALFNETQSRVILSVPAANATAVLALATWRGIPARRLGTVGGACLTLRCGDQPFQWPVASLRDCWWNSISRLMTE
jgi:phosphoribosylformylglycinamidine synthase subunit PurL